MTKRKLRAMATYNKRKPEWMDSELAQCGSFVLGIGVLSYIVFAAGNCIAAVFGVVL